MPSKHNSLTGKYKHGYMVYLTDEETALLNKLKTDLQEEQPGAAVSNASVFRMGLYSLLNTRREKRNASKA